MDEEHLRQKWGRLGGIAFAMSDEKQGTKAWATGAIGEERLGARLDSLVSDSIAVLHDRSIPGTKTNIDHIAITAAGVWVIDAKRYKGRPELKIEGGIFRPRVEKVLVGRRDCTKLVRNGVLKQIDLVRKVVGDLPVTGALCFVEADWPLIGGAFTTRGVHALWPKRLTKLLVEAEGSSTFPRLATCWLRTSSPLKRASEVGHEVANTNEWATPRLTRHKTSETSAWRKVDAALGSSETIGKKSTDSSCMNPRMYGMTSSSSSGSEWRAVIPCRCAAVRH